MKKEIKKNKNIKNSSAKKKVISKQNNNNFLKRELNKNFKILIVVLVIIFGFLIFLLAHKTIFAPTKNANSNIVGIYTGKFPCADCEGIQTTLTLYQNPNTLKPTTYSLELVYLGRNVKPFDEVGNWTYTNGMKNNPNALIYQLNPNNSNQTEYYLKVNNTELKMLDSNKNEIPSNLNFTLMKK